MWKVLKILKGWFLVVVLFSSIESVWWNCGCNCDRLLRCICGLVGSGMLLVGVDMGVGVGVGVGIMVVFVVMCM